MVVLLTLTIQEGSLDGPHIQQKFIGFWNQDMVIRHLMWPSLNLHILDCVEVSKRNEKMAKRLYSHYKSVLIQQVDENLDLTPL